MKKYIIFVSLCLIFMLLQAQIQMPRMKIVNSGDLMSTFRLNSNEEAQKEIREQVGETVLQDIVKYCEESSWPSGISSLQGRNANRPLIADYTAYRVTAFGADKYNVILCIPPDKNTFQPTNMQANHNIYFIIGKGGVSEVAGEFYTLNISPKNEIKPSEQANSQGFSYTIKPDDAKDFSSQLNVLIESLHNNFTDIKGEEIKEEMSFGDKYTSKVQLEGANETYIYKGLGGGTTLVATFGEYKDETEATRQYLALAEAVNETPLRCCTLVRNTDDNETLRTNYWLPFDINDKMHPAMKNMVMEVQMMKTLGIDANTFKTYDNYSVVLRIYHQE